MKYLITIAILLLTACNSYNSALEKFIHFSIFYESTTFSERTLEKCAKLIYNEVMKNGLTFSYTYAPESLIIWNIIQSKDKTLLNVVDINHKNGITKRQISYHGYYTIDYKNISTKEIDKYIDITIPRQYLGSAYIKTQFSDIYQINYLPQINTLEKIDIDTISNPVIKEYAQTLVKYIEPLIK